jgi:predicted 3-demethylubiquinone-9 3-methyltransferase (glyoxalase superfamily)
MQTIVPCLFFDGKAEDAVNFYTSVFKSAKVGHISRYGDNMPMPKGSVMTVELEIEGQTFLALNGPPMFSFSPAISFMVNCETQQDIDHYWEKLSEGGETQQCGWLKDQFGVSWQVVPNEMPHLMGRASPAQSQKVMEAVMKMKKLDIAALKQAYDKAA